MSLDPPQAVLPKSTKPRTGGNEARISTAVGAPTGAAVPVRLYQAAVRTSSAEAAASRPRTPYERGTALYSSAPPTARGHCNHRPVATRAEGDPFYVVQHATTVDRE